MPVDNKPCKDVPAPTEDAPKSSTGSNCGEKKFRVRLFGLAVSAVCLPVLAVAVWLEPDVRGYDTHTALGWPPCGFPLQYGLPCPACGMTTAFANLVHGHIVEAFKSQIFGALLAAAMVVYCFAALAQVFSGRDFLKRIMPKKSWILPLVSIFLAAWAVKAILMYYG